MPGTPAAVNEQLQPVICRIRLRLAQGTEKRRIKVRYTRDIVIKDRRSGRDDTVGPTERTIVPSETDLSG